MNSRPEIGTRVRLSRNADEAGDGAGKLATVVAHHRDGTAIVVRVDPQKPLQRFRDKEAVRGIAPFRRRLNDWVIDFYYVSKAGGR